MLTTLKGAPLYGAVAIVLAVIGAITYLASQNIMSGADVLTVITLILTGVVGITSAHVAGQTASAAFNTPPPAAPLPSPASPPEGVPPQEQTI